MKKAYFQYYETFEVILEKIKDKHQRGELREAIIRYGLYGTTPEDLTEVEDMAFTICRDIIDQQRHRCEINSQNATPAEKRKREAFVPPTLEEVNAYCKERNNGISGERFIEYYTNKRHPWTTGNQREPMRDWRAAVRQWERTERKSKADGTLWANNSTDAQTAEYEKVL